MRYRGKCSYGHEAAAGGTGGYDASGSGAPGYGWWGSAEKGEGMVGNAHYHRIRQGSGQRKGSHAGFGSG